MYQERGDFAVVDEHATESSQQPTRETATGGASPAVLEHGSASPPHIAHFAMCGFLRYRTVSEITITILSVGSLTVV